MSRRAQILSFDLVIALGIATLVWGTLVFTFSLQESRWDERQTHDARTLHALHLADTLLLTPGFPTGWESYTALNQIKAVGLASSPHRLSTAKVNTLFSLEIDDAKELLNLPPSRANFTIKTTTGTTLASYGDATGQNTSTVVLTRPVIYNGTTHLFEITLED